MQLSWAGECSAWECDELGHMNMRFYLYKVAQARAMLFLRMGLGEIRIQPVDLHIRYMGEARPGDPLHMHSGVLEQNGSSCRLLHILYHADDRIAATIVEQLDLPSNLPRLGHDWHVSLPDIARPRGVDLSRPLSVLDCDKAIEEGFRHIGCGVFRTDEAGSDGRVKVEALMGRVTETVGHFRQAWPENYARGNAGDISGVLLEAQLNFYARPRPGQGYDFFSGLLSSSGKIRTLRHIIVDAEKGAPIMTMIGVAGIMDLKERRLLDIDLAVQASLETLTIKA